MLLFIRFVFCLLLGFTSTVVEAEDWLQWRGPTGDHHASVEASAPSEWSEEEGLAWITPLPGKGHSSATIVGSRIYLTTADKVKQTQSLLILERDSGKLLLETVVHTGGLPDAIHPNNTNASPTVASDGNHVFTLFYNSSFAWLTAYDLEGKQLWQEKAFAFDPQMYQFGFGSSPRLVDGVLIAVGEYDGPGSSMVGVDPATGKQLWLAKRPNMISFSTPAIVSANDKNELLLSGNSMLASYDPRNGKENWSVPGTTQATCGTMVWDNKLGLAFASGGYPESFTLAVEMTGNHRVVWQNRTKCYEQSMLVVDGYLYGMADSGVMYCWRGTDGQEMWKKRLGGPVSSSPVLVDGRIYVSNEAGTTFVMNANPERYEPIATNQLGNVCFATPTPLDGRLYHRFAKDENGIRQEYLAAIGK